MAVLSQHAMQVVDAAIDEIGAVGVAEETRRCAFVVVAGMFNWSHQHDRAHVGYELQNVYQMLAGASYEKSVAMDLHALNRICNVFDAQLRNWAAACEAERQERIKAIRSRAAKL